MAKEQDQLIKRVELKVSVNCCDGCRSKVLKALNLKGVLRTEVHPTAGRVAVIGDVDADRLVKRLAKVGKIAEVITRPTPEEGEKRRHDGGDKNGRKEASTENGKNMGGENAGGKAAKHGADSDKRGKNGDEGSGASSARARHGVPEGADVRAAAMCYHRAEPAMAVPVQLAYYTANCTMPPPPRPSPYYGGCYHGIPPPALSCRGPIPVVRPQPTRFVDEGCLYRNDDTAGCHVM